MEAEPRWAEIAYEAIAPSTTIHRPPRLRGCGSARCCRSSSGHGLRSGTVCSTSPAAPARASSRCWSWAGR